MHNESITRSINVGHSGEVRKTTEIGKVKGNGWRLFPSPKLLRRSLTNLGHCGEVIMENGQDRESNREWLEDLSFSKSPSGEA